jgi:hypothetical protein
VSCIPFIVYHKSCTCKHEFQAVLPSLLTHTGDHISPHHYLIDQKWNYVIQDVEMPCRIVSEVEGAGSSAQLTALTPDHYLLSVRQESNLRGYSNTMGALWLSVLSDALRIRASACLKDVPALVLAVTGSLASQALGSPSRHEFESVDWMIEIQRE